MREKEGWASRRQRGGKGGREFTADEGQRQDRAPGGGEGQRTRDQSEIHYLVFKEREAESQPPGALDTPSRGDLGLEGRSGGLQRGRQEANFKVSR